MIKPAGIVALAIACAMTAKADWKPNFQPDGYPYNFGPSALVPKWSEVKAGEWTFNYEGVLAKAKAEGKYTLLLFSGMWWCPHCQALEANVLLKDAFKKYVSERGYYLAALDFPYRDGHSMWMWLWDPAYRAANGIGDWTPQQIADECVKRFEYQGLMHAEGTATSTNSNVLVEISADGSTTNLAVYAANPTTVYRRVVYPTIIVIDPEGNEAGRFEYNKRTDSGKGPSYVIDAIEAIRTGGRSDLFAKPGAGGIEGDAAQTYDAVLADASGSPVGVATFKTSRQNPRTDLITVTGSIQIAGGRKVSLKGTAVGTAGEKISLVKNGSPFTATVMIGAEGVVGSCTDGEANYAVQGARNPFRGRDAASKARAATLKKDCWTFVLADSGKGGSRFTRGYSSFSVAMGAKGKAKITGVLGDGSKVTLSAQALFGEGGKVLVPVIGKKGAFSAMLEFNNWKLSAVKGVSGWNTAKSSGGWSPNAVFAASAGAGEVPETMYLQIEGFDPAAGIDGKAIAASPVDDAVLSTGKKWSGTRGVTDLKVTFSKKNGTFKGSFNVYVTDGGRRKKLKATVSGVVVNGVPYGAAVMRNVGAWAVKLVGSCGGGC